MLLRRKLCSQDRSAGADFPNFLDRFFDLLARVKKPDEF